MLIYLISCFNTLSLILQPLAVYCLMSPNLRYTYFLFLICECTFILCHCRMLLYTFTLSFFACLFISFPVLTPFPYVDLEPISIYHPTSEETPTTIGTPTEGFFDGADLVAKATAYASATAI